MLKLKESFEKILLVVLLLYVLIILLMPISSNLIYLFKVINIKGGYTYLIIIISLYFIFIGLKSLLIKKIQQPYRIKFIDKFLKLVNIAEIISGILALPLLSLFFI